MEDKENEIFEIKTEQFIPNQYGFNEPIDNPLDSVSALAQRNRFAGSRTITKQKKGSPETYNSQKLKRKCNQPLIPREHVEIKWSYYNITAHAINTFWDKWLLNGVQHGVGPNARIGNRVVAKQIEVRLLIYNPDYENNYSVPTTLRVIIVDHKDAHHTAIAVDDVLDDANDGNNSKTLQLYNIDHEGQFDILHDELLTHQNYGQIPVNRHWVIPLHFTQIFNTANNGSIADIEKHALYLMIVGTIPAANMYHVNIQACTRYSYSEL